MKKRSEWKHEKKLRMKEKCYEWKKNVTNERKMLRIKENVTNDSKSYEWKQKSYEWKKKSYEWKKKVTNERKKVTNERKKGYERREKKFRRKRKKVTNEEKKKVTNEEKKKVTNEQKKKVTNEEKKKEVTNEEKKKVTNEEKKRLRMKRKKKVTNEEKKGYVWGVSALYCCAVWSHGPPTAIPFGHRCTVGVNRDPPVCWSTQAGRWINDAPTLWLLLWCCIALSWIRVCACDHIEHAATNTLPRSNARVVNLGRFGQHCVAPYTFNLNSLEEEFFTFLATHAGPFTCKINSWSSSQSHV